MSTQKRTNEKRTENLRNEDPISGESGAHPVGAGMGAALGGALAGAASGLAAGPVGTVAGAILGGVAGGLAGKAAAEKIDPTVELDYWRDAHADRPYFNDDYTFEDYEPAYRAGVGAYDPNVRLTWEERQELARELWEEDKTTGRLTWDDAQPAAQDAYGRISSRYPKKAK